MPLFPDEGHRTHKASHHPPIYEQKGRFFFADGSEIVLATVKKMLDYNEDICARFGIKLNHAKRHWVHNYEKSWSKQITPDMGGT